MIKVQYFCKKDCCPYVQKTNDGKFILGDPKGEEGITTWNQESFRDFIEAAKKGNFDYLLD